MLDLNLYGGPFQHSLTSTLWKKPKNITWKTDKSGVADFYLDYWLPKPILDNKTRFNSPRPTYGWIVESRSVIPEVEEMLKNLKTSTLIYYYDRIFTHRKEFITSDLFRWVPATGIWIDDDACKLYKKRKLVSCISSNKAFLPGHRRRLEMISKFSNKVDLFGSGFYPIDNKLHGLKDYMYSFAIENDSYPGYFTEKILDCFATGTIPIYYGDPEIDKVFNPDGIIPYSEGIENLLTEDYFRSKMAAVVENFHIATSNFRTVEDYMYEKKYLN